MPIILQFSLIHSFHCSRYHRLRPSRSNLKTAAEVDDNTAIICARLRRESVDEDRAATSGRARMAMYVVMPESSGDFMAIFSGIPGIIGACAGVVYNISHGCDAVLDSTGAAAGLVFSLCEAGSKIIINLAPSSQALSVMGAIIYYLGYYFAFCAGVGGFIGAGLVWVIGDVIGGLIKSHKCT